MQILCRSRLIPAGHRKPARQQRSRGKTISTRRLARANLSDAMKIPLLLACALFLLTACPSEQWIQVGNSRAAVVPQHVRFLDAPPTRPHEVVGIITPPAGEYETEAEAVKGMRKQAAKHGADALYIESQTETGGWKFGSGYGGVSGGSFSELRFRAKAIVWK